MKTGRNLRPCVNDPSSFIFAGGERLENARTTEQSVSLDTERLAHSRAGRAIMNPGIENVTVETL